jgi:hypothetical protein
MINLAVDQHDAGDGAIAQCATGLKRRISLQLGRDIG